MVTFQSPQGEQQAPKPPPMQELRSGAPGYAFLFIGVLFVLAAIAIIVGLSFALWWVQ